MSLPMMWNAGQNVSVRSSPSRAKRQRRVVVEQRVEPDVEDVVRVPRDLDAPGDLRAAEADVVQAAGDERERLVVALARAHEVRPLGVQLLQRLLEGGQPEEPVLLALAVERDLVDRARVVLADLVLGLEVRAARAVPALVGALVDVPVVVDALHDVLDAALVARVGGADEVVVGDVDARHQRLEALGVAVGELLRRDALALGRLRDRLAVLVGAGEEEHLLAALAHVAGEDVGADRGVRVPEVGRGVDVEDRRGDVVGHRRRRTLAAGEHRGGRATPPQADPHATAHRPGQQNREPEPRRPRRQDSNRGRSGRGAAARAARGTAAAAERRAALLAAAPQCAAAARAAAARLAAPPAPRAATRRAAAPGRRSRSGRPPAHAEVQPGVVARAGQRPDPARPRAPARRARRRRSPAAGASRDRRRSAPSRRRRPAHTTRPEHAARTARPARPRSRRRGASPPGTGQRPIRERARHRPRDRGHERRARRRAWRSSADRSE